MSEPPAELTFDLTGADAAALLRHWRWLVADTYRPLLATALGDLFLADAEGRAWWLDVGAGQLVPVAEDAGHLAELLEAGEDRDVWLGPGLVGQLRAGGAILRPGDCYSYQTVPILGGDFVPANFRVRPLQAHLDLWGPIQEKIKDLPDGAEVEFIVGE
jgi:hypothetical protein